MSAVLARFISQDSTDRCQIRFQVMLAAVFADPCQDPLTIRCRLLLAELAADSLVDIFGRDLQPVGAATCRVPEFQGLRSLGCYWAHRPSLHLQTTADPPRIRLGFDEDSRRYQVPVTDIRMYADDHITPDTTVVERLSRALENQTHVLVSVGLSRAYKRTDQHPAVHWLQINNIYLPPK